MSDLSELVTSRRFEQINHARERVLEQERKAADALLEGRLDKQTANMLIRRAVENYIHEVENLLDPPKKKSNPVKTDYWRGVDLGTVRLPNGEIVEFDGLESVLECPNPMTFTTTEMVENGRRGRTEETVTKQVQIPRDVLIDAYRAVNRFLAELGFEIDPSEGKTQTWHFRYIGDDEEGEEVENGETPSEEPDDGGVTA